MLLDRLSPQWAAFQQEARAGVRVLVADDEPAATFVVSEGLASRGFAAESAGSAEETRARLAAERYDLLVVDKNLPDASGVDLVREARAAYPGLPCVMMTAYPTASTVVEALTAGAVDYIAKPFSDIDHVMNRLQSVIDLRLSDRLHERMVRDLTGALTKQGDDQELVAWVGSRLFEFKRELAARTAVLVIEDNAAVAEVVRRTLAAARLHTSVAPNVVAARTRLIKPDGPLAALISVDLPAAVESVEELRALDPQLEVVVTSGSSDTATALAAVSAGAADFVLRRFEGVDVLRARMQRAVGRGRRRRLYHHLVTTLYHAAQRAGDARAAQMLHEMPAASEPRSRVSEIEVIHFGPEEVDLSDLFDGEAELDIEIEPVEVSQPEVVVRTPADTRTQAGYRREHRRVDVGLEVRFRNQDDGGNFVYSNLRDISEGGMFIAMEEPLPVGSRLSVEVLMGWSDDGLRLDCEVVRAVSGRGGGRRGIGVKFVGDRAHVEQVITDLTQRLVPA